MLPDECGHLLVMQNRAVVIKRCTTSEVLNQFIIVLFIYQYYLHAFLIA